MFRGQTSPLVRVHENVTLGNPISVCPNEALSKPDGHFVCELWDMLGTGKAEGWPLPMGTAPSSGKMVFLPVSRT